MAHVFHDHLDACRQCREYPMALCPAGAAALASAVQDNRRPRIEDFFASDRCLMCADPLPADRAHDPYCSAQCAILSEADNDND